MNPGLTETLRSAFAHTGVSLEVLSRDGEGVLVIFLRHTGCTFCREALADVAKVRGRIEGRGVGLALVHMGAESAETSSIFGRYGLDDLPRVSDPSRALYRAMGLGRGTARQLFGLRCWMRGFRAGVIDGHWVGGLVGDGFQMPGVFLLRDGLVVASFVHETAADRPDYVGLVCAAPSRAVVGDVR